MSSKTVTAYCQESTCECDQVSLNLAEDIAKKKKKKKIEESISGTVTHALILAK